MPALPQAPRRLRRQASAVVVVVLLPPVVSLQLQLPLLLLLPIGLAVNLWLRSGAAGVLAKGTAALR